MYQCKILLDSIHNNNRLTTFVVTYPRIIHAEVRTHRALSMNSSSSRAIPIDKMIKNITEDPFIPEWWGQNKSGMQAIEEIENPEDAKRIWLEALNDALKRVEQLKELKVHKQLVNRLLEPWMWITVIITATDFYNFFGLRMHKDAQPEIQIIARMMYEEYINSQPKQLYFGEWHLPFIKEEERTLSLELKQKLSAARCARVSYLTHTGENSIEKDLKTYSTLAESKPAHMSPLEHQATPLMDNSYSANFCGWKQFRKTLAHEVITKQTFTS